jgi:hypothetical protein
VKRLITDRDLLSGAISGTIVLDGSTILTPAARDRALRMGLQIVEAGTGAWHALAPTAACAAPPAAGACARCGSAACAGGCATCANASPGNCARCGNVGCSCAGAAGLQLASGGGHAATLGALADGLYLVRVQAGRATQVLPATGPGLMQRARTA